jgi:hypothetical protein
LDQIEDRPSGLEDKVDVIMHSSKDRLKSKEVLMEYAKLLGHH